MKEEIIKVLQKIVGVLTSEKIDIKLEVPADPSHGDYSTNIALVLFGNKELGIKNQGFKSPREFAEYLALKIRNLKLENLDRVEVAEPGFINFWVSKQLLAENLRLINEEKDRFGRSKKKENKKIMLEFGDPNPFKEFHIGHLRNISLGEAYARLLEFQGAEVWRVNYQGDVGLHVAKALFGLLQKSNIKNQISKIGERTAQEKVAVLAEAYVVGSRAYEEDGEAKKEIEEINKKIYQKDPSVLKLWEMGRRWSLEYFETIYRRVGTVYDRYYFESEVADPGRKIVLEHISDRIFEKHEGAVVYRGEGEGLHTRVFVTRDDYATYEAKDLALAKIKYDDFAYDLSIIITAHEQKEYFKVVLSALAKIAPMLGAKTIHDSFGFVSLKDVKMSSRLGNIITGEWLLDTAKDRIKKAFPEMAEETAELVAVGAVKYSMLKYSRESDIAFSFDESISLEGNSGPYLQYTFARTQSVLRKTQNLELKTKNDWEFDIGNLTFEIEEENLLRHLVHFCEIVEEAAEKFAPNLICNYLFDLAQKFNLFYQKHSILEGGEKRDFRLLLTAAVGQVLKNGLYLLGIKAPEKM